MVHQKRPTLYLVQLVARREPIFYCTVVQHKYSYVVPGTSAFISCFSLLDFRGFLQSSTGSTQQQQAEKKYKNIILWGFHCPAWLWVGGTSPRDYSPDFATLNFERPGHAPRSLAGSHTCAAVYTRAACVPHQVTHVPCAIWPWLGYVPGAT